VSNEVKVVSDNEDLSTITNSPTIILSDNQHGQSPKLPNVHPINVYVVKKSDNRRLRVLLAQLRARRISLTTIDEKGNLTRRDFITGKLTKTRLVNAPVVFNGSCMARYGCTQCVDACPSGAISINNKVVMIDAGKCIECGSCVAACPTGSLAMAGADDNEYVVAINEASRAGFRRLRFTCIYDNSQDSDDEYTYKLPCIASVGPEWLTMALASFDEVSFTCPNESCKLNGVAKVKELLSNLTKAIKVEVSGLMVKRPKGYSDYLTYVGIRRSDYSSALRRLKALSTGELAYGLKIFDINISEDKCSFCGVCFAKCPGKAFDVDSAQGVTVLKFNAIKCLGCGLCVDSCPEKAIKLTVSSLNDEWIIKVKDEVVKCKICGKPFDTRRHIQMVKARMGIKGDPEWLYLCPDCRRYYTAKEMLKRNLSI